MIILTQVKASCTNITEFTGCKSDQCDGLFQPLYLWVLYEMGTAMLKEKEGYLRARRLRDKYSFKKRKWNVSFLWLSAVTLTHMITVSVSAYDAYQSLCLKLSHSYLQLQRFDWICNNSNNIMETVSTLYCQIKVSKDVHFGHSMIVKRKESGLQFW